MSARATITQEDADRAIRDAAPGPHRWDPIRIRCRFSGSHRGDLVEGKVPVERRDGAAQRGGGRGGINPYSDQQLAQAELQAILDCCAGSKAAAADNFAPPPERRAVLLAYEKEGRPATGKDGLIQLIVGPDEAAGRYSNWVKTIEVVPPPAR